MPLIRWIKQLHGVSHHHKRLIVDAVAGAMHTVLSQDCPTCGNKFSDGDKHEEKVTDILQTN